MCEGERELARGRRREGVGKGEGRGGEEERRRGGEEERGRIAIESQLSKKQIMSTLFHSFRPYLCSTICN